MRRPNHNKSFNKKFNLIQFSNPYIKYSKMKNNIKTNTNINHKHFFVKTRYLKKKNITPADA